MATDGEIEDRGQRFRAEAADIAFSEEAAVESESMFAKLRNSRLVKAAALLWEGYP